MDSAITVVERMDEDESERKASRLYDGMNLLARDIVPINPPIMEATEEGEGGT